MATPAPGARGLSAAELAAVVAELQPLVGASVLDVAALGTPPGNDDLLLVLQGSPDGARRAFVHVAPGGARARVTTTARRFAQDAFVRTGPRDALARELADATLIGLTHTAGERRCAFAFRTPRGERRLVVELFGARGLWALLDAGGRVLVLPRNVETAVRQLRAGDAYAAPPAATEPRMDGPNRFAAPVLAAVDAFYAQQDLAIEGAREHERLHRATQRALQKAKARAEGLGQQLADAGRSQAMRAQADLMLAYAHLAARGAAQMDVPDPERDGEMRRLELDPSRPVVVQAQTLYEKARRLDDGRAIAERRHAEAVASMHTLSDIAARIASVSPATATSETLAGVRRELQVLGVVPLAEPAAVARSRDRVAARGENFRCFASAEGYPILVGRDNEQNDRLTMRTARGNDLWLHVGGGRPGSHVVVRLPKQKTASLETLLDAATLAVHFSKARGEPRIDVIYTQRKHVRKHKGLPAGAVVPSQTRTITVHFDETRLKRLLDSSAGDGQT